MWDFLRSLSIFAHCSGAEHAISLKVFLARTTNYVSYKTNTITIVTINKEGDVCERSQSQSSQRVSVHF